MSSLIKGQLLIDIAGPELSKEDKEIICHPRVSGVVLFAKNFVDSSQLIQLCKNIHNIKNNLIICADQEGGRVQRFVSEGQIEKLLPISDLGKLAKQDVNQAMSLAKRQGQTMSSNLIKHGVDVSFAPVLDCYPESGSDVLRDRCFCSDPKQIIKLAANYVSGMADEGMLAIVKHFPGHGGVSSDTHTEKVIDNRSLDELLERDILPYIALQSALQGVMLSHIIFPEFDEMPCSLSSKWVNYLKNDLQLHTQLIVSDCMSMRAVSAVIADPIERVCLAFDIGVDLAIFCNDRVSVEKILNCLPSVTNHVIQKKLAKCKLV